MNGCALTASVTALVSNLTEEEQNLVGVVLTQLGVTLLTMATQRSICRKI